jgi:hypothetical protein
MNEKMQPFGSSNQSFIMTTRLTSTKINYKYILYKVNIYEYSKYNI